MTFITISEELNYQFVFLSPPYFSKLYMHYTYIYRTSYFDLIIDSSSVNETSLKPELRKRGFKVKSASNSYC